MKATIITEIEKTQNGVYGKYDKETESNNFTPIADDYFYSGTSFIGSKIKFEFTKEEGFSKFTSASTYGLNTYVRDAIKDKIQELKPNGSFGLIIDYIIEEKYFSKDGVLFTVVITRCEADC